MIRDITLGQYFPGKSIIHRVDPRFKLIITMLYIAAVFTARTPAGYAAVTAFLIFVIVSSRISKRMILRSVRPLLFFVILTVLLNIFYTPGTILVKWWIFRVTKEGLIQAGSMVLRILLLIVGTSMLTYTTSPIMLTDGIERLLSPLKKIRLPVHELAMMMTIALRFIPTLIEETDKIIKAQRARGADFESGNIFRRAKALVPLLIPLFVSAFRRAEELATAMECRCYKGGEDRTKYRVVKARWSDGLALLTLVALIAGVVTLGKLGI